MPRRAATAIRPADRARGQRMEQLFQAWLDRDGLPYFYFNQTPLTVPAAFKGRLKRPDFAVGLPGVGTIAFDVKAKRLSQDHFIIDVDEQARLAAFEEAFDMVVWYAIFPPREAPYCFLFRNRDILPVTTYAAGKPVLLMPCSRALYVDYSREELMPAVLGYGANRSRRDL
jgi:hypothetical protein